MYVFCNFCCSLCTSLYRPGAGYERGNMLAGAAALGAQHLIVPAALAVPRRCAGALAVPRRRAGALASAIPHPTSSSTLALPYTLTTGIYVWLFLSFGCNRSVYIWFLYLFKISMRTCTQLCVLVRIVILKKFTIANFYYITCNERKEVIFNARATNA